MRLARVLVALAATAMLCAPALAQQSHDNIALVYSVKAKLADIGKLDAAMKKHFAWHRANKDVFTWYVWQVASGDDIGDFLVGSFGHQWKEFDDRAAFDEKDDADFFPNVLPLVEKSTLGYWTMLADVSYPGKGTEPAAMAQITHYYLKPDWYVQFLDALHEMHAALGKVSPAMGIQWYRLISGGEGPQLVLAVDRDNWASMAMPGKSFDDMLVDAVGAQKAVSILTAIRQSTRYTRSYMLRYRPDISYIAPK